MDEDLQLATSQVHRFRVKGWVKVVVESGTGLRIADAFVIVYPRGRDPVDAHSDANGEIELQVPYGKVEVEFPGLFRVTHVRSERARDVPASERGAAIREGEPYRAPARPVRASRGADSHVAPPPDEESDDDVDGDDEDEGLDLTDREPEGSTLPEDDEEDEGEDGEDDADEYSSLGEVVDDLVVECPSFIVDSNRAHVFRVPGTLALRLSRAYFRDGYPNFELYDEDGEQLVQAQVRSQRLTANVGIGCYRVVVAGQEVELASMPHASLVQFVAREER